MNDKCEVVVFEIRRDPDGLYTATSQALAGMCVVHRDKERIIEDMPNIVRLWFKKNRGLDVEPFWGERREFDDISAFPMITVPAEVAAQALAR